MFSVDQKGTCLDFLAKRFHDVIGTVRLSFRTERRLSKIDHLINIQAAICRRRPTSTVDPGDVRGDEAWLAAFQILNAAVFINVINKADYPIWQNAR
ncbi:MAG TPA: hypothetical protein VGC77_21430 [Rhodopseudomonas sp.]|uniref:hypothetical protein n=1 Tax=Rhodopseudomonas sp. TaxID=1078 RepID=UPI002ED9D492